MAHEEVRLRGHAADERDVDAAVDECGARLLERGVELRGAWVRDAIGPLHVERDRYVVGGHVRKTTEGEEGVRLLIAAGPEALHVEATLVHRCGEHWPDVGLEERDVAHREEEPRSLAARRCEAGARERARG